jgi:hypothetical protein
VRTITIITLPHTNGEGRHVIDLDENMCFVEIAVDGTVVAAVDLTTESDADDDGDQDKLVVFEAVEGPNFWERIAEVEV